MALSENTKIDLIQVLENGVVQVREKTSIFRDDIEISHSFNRYTIAPGDGYSDQPNQIKAICQATHTEETIKKYQEELQKNDSVSLNN